MADVEIQHYLDQSGGQQNRTTKYLQRDNEWALIYNGILDNVGGINKRNGYTILGAAMGSAGSILELAPFNYGGSTQRLIAYRDDFYIWNGSTWAAQSNIWSGVTDVHSETYLDEFFAVNLEKATTNYDPDGGGWTTTRNVTGAPKAKYIQSFQARLFLGHCKIGSTYHRSRIYYSTLPVSGAITWDTTEGTGSYIDVRTDDGDYIMGLSESGNRMLVFKLNSLHRLSIDSAGNQTLVQVPDAPGTSAQRSIINIAGRTYYFNPTYGILEYDGASARPISLAVHDYIRGIQAPESVVAWSDGFVYWLYVGAVTHPNDSDLNLTKGIICYDTTTNTYTVGEVANVVTAADSWYNSNEVETFIGDNAGRVLEWDRSTKSDNGTDISLRARTKIYWDASPALVKLYEKALIYADPQGSLKVTYRVVNRQGYGDWQEMKGLDNLIEEINISPRYGEGRGIQFEFSESSSNKTPVIEGISLFYSIVDSQYGK